MIWGDEAEELLEWDCGMEYGAGPGNGPLRRGRLGSGEPLWI